MSDKVRQPPARRIQRHPARVDTRGDTPAESDPRVGSWLGLQASAGNAAVTSTLRMQRDEGAGPGTLSMRRPAGQAGTSGLPSLVPRLTPQQMAEIFAAEQRREAEVRPRLVRWLDTERHGIVGQGIQGTLSMPELVARIRQEVEGAATVQPVWIERLVRAHLGGQAPPATRRTVTQGGVLSEIAAIISNATSASVKVGTDAANLKVGITGTVTGKAGPVGVEVTHKAVGLDIAFPFVGGSTGKLKGKVSYKGEWEVGISLPLAGRKPVSAHPTAEAIGKSVREAEEAARKMVALLNQGESPDSEAMKELGSKIGAALKDIGKVAETTKAQGPQLTLELGVQGGEREIPQPGGGDAVKMPEIKGGVNLILRF